MPYLTICVILWHFILTENSGSISRIFFAEFEFCRELFCTLNTRERKAVLATQNGGLAHWVLKLVHPKLKNFEKFECFP
jgi:hypothetical protein